MSRRQERQRTRVHNPQPLRSDDPRPGIHDRPRIVRLPHRARRSSMIYSMKTISDDFHDLLVRRHISAREVLRSNRDVRHSIRSEDSTAFFKRCERHCAVGRVSQPVRVDERGNVHIGRGDGDVSPRKGGDKGHEDRSVVVAVVRDSEGGEAGVSGEGGGDDVFEVGPVVRECCEVGECGRGKVGGDVGVDFGEAWFGCQFVCG